MAQTHDLQRETMRLYRALTRQHEHWGGKLVFVRCIDCAHGCAAAVSIAGGTTLVLDSDAAAMKAAQRAGYLDFVVYSLDEALRALKNEVRQKRSLSVGLIADDNAALADMDERGVQPDLRLDPAALLKNCAPIVDGELFFPGTDGATLRGVDTALLAAIPADDAIRRRWIERAPQFLREARIGGRWIWLSDEELAALTAQGLTPAPRP